MKYILAHTDPVNSIIPIYLSVFTSVCVNPLKIKWAFLVVSYIYVKTYTTVFVFLEFFIPHFKGLLTVRSAEKRGCNLSHYNFNHNITPAMKSHP